MTGGSSLLPEELRDLLTSKVMAHITSIDDHGAPLTHIVWVDTEGDLLLVTSPKGSAKGRNLRARPQVALAVHDPRDPERWLSIQGEVIAIRDDEGLAFINRLSHRYLGIPYYRFAERDIFVIRPIRVRFSLGPSQAQLEGFRKAGIKRQLVDGTS